MNIDVEHLLYDLGKALVAAAVVLLLMLGFLPPARADTWLVGTVASYHLDRSVDHCERNYGLGLEQGVWNNTRLVGGVYNNSYCRQSEYIGLVWAPIHYGKVHLGFLAGGVTGYNSAIDPVVMPTIAVEGRHLGMNLGIMPALDSKIITVVGLQLKWRFR